jgi:ribosome recycling factor
MDINEAKANLDKCLTHLQNELAHLHTGRATTELIEDVMVEAYDTQSPLKNVANLSVADSKTLVVQPWDKTIVDEVSRGISAANLGFSPQTEGDIVRVKIPDLTEERRKEFVKIMKDKCEDARVAVRGVRKSAMQDIDALVSGGMSEDEGKRMKEEVEKHVKSINEKIEEVKDHKENELLTI